MKCQFCSKPATVHVTKIVNKDKREMHLCDACAREKNLTALPPQEFNVPALLQLVLSQMPVPTRPTPADTICPECGTPYAHFRARPTRVRRRLRSLSLPLGAAARQDPKWVNAAPGQIAGAASPADGAGAARRAVGSTENGR